MIKISKNGITRCVAVYKDEGLIVDESWIADGKGLDPTVGLSLGHYFAMPNEIVNLPIDADDEIAMMCETPRSFEIDTLYNAVVMIVSNDEMSSHYKAGDYVGGRLKDPPMNLIRSLIKILYYLSEGWRTIFPTAF